MRTCPLIIVGLGETAQMAYEQYFLPAWPSRPIRFAVDEAYLPPDRALLGCPVLCLDDLPAPDGVEVFVAIPDNAGRRAVYERLLARGYHFATYIHPSCTVGPHVSIGQNVLIQEDNRIQYYAEVGDNCLLWAGNHIGHRTTIAAHCFLASEITISGFCQIGEQSYIGVGAWFRDKVQIGPHAIVGAGAGVTKDLPGHQTYIGTPARAMEAR